MSLRAVTDRYWIFENWFGSFVEVSRANHPEYQQALARARDKANG